MKRGTNRLYSITTCILAMMLLTCCTRQHVRLMVSFKETSFDEELSCVGMIDDSTCFVGSEHGSIYILRNGKIAQTLHSDEARIYAVMLTKGDTAFVGIRNSSLAKILLPAKGDSRFVRLSPHNYTIPVKGYRYSAYGFVSMQDYIFAATSNGLYYFSAHEDGNTLPMSCIEDGNHANGQPFAFCSPVRLNNNAAACFATDSGIVKITLTPQRPHDASSKQHSPLINSTIKLEGKKLLKLVKDETTDTLYALSEKCVYKVAADNMNIADSAVLNGFTALSMERAKGKLYLVNETSLHVAHTFNDLKTNNNIVEVGLPHHVPSNTRNVIVYDKGEQMIHIVTDHALLSFPALNAIGESESDITHACADTKTGAVFFLNNYGEIYKWNDRLKVAHKTMQLPSTDKVAAMYADNGNIYYVTSTTNMLKTTRENMLSHFHPNAGNVCKLEKAVTAMLVTDNKAYVGIRDLLKVHQLNGKKNSFTINSVKEPFVTRMVKHNNKVFATTLNDGIWIIEDTTAHYIKGTDSIHFMNDIAFIDNNQMLLLNNHYLYNLRFQADDYKQCSVERLDSIPGYERIFVVKSNPKDNSHAVMLISKYDASILYINNGVTKLAPVKALNNQTIRPDGCIDMGSYKLIAADGGILRIENNMLTDADNDKYDQQTFLKFDLTEYDNSRNLLFLVCATVVLLLTAGGIYIVNERKRMRKTVRTIAQKNTKRLAETAKNILHAASLIDNEDLLAKAQSMTTRIENYGKDAAQKDEAQTYQALNSDLHVLMLDVVNNVKLSINEQRKQLALHNFNQDLITATDQALETQHLKTLTEACQNNIARLKNIEAINILATESPAWSNCIQRQMKTLIEDNRDETWTKLHNNIAETLQLLLRGDGMKDMTNLIGNLMTVINTATDIEDGAIINDIQNQLSSLNENIGTIHRLDTCSQTEWLIKLKSLSAQLLLANCMGAMKQLVINYNAYYKKATPEYKLSLEEKMRKEIKTFYQLEGDNMQTYISTSTNYRDFYPLFLTGAIEGKSSHYVNVVFPSQESNDDVPRLAKHQLKKKLKEKQKQGVFKQKTDTNNYDLTYYLEKYIKGDNDN